MYCSRFGSSHQLGVVLKPFSYARRHHSDVGPAGPIGAVAIACAPTFRPCVDRNDYSVIPPGHIQAEAKCRPFQASIMPDAPPPPPPLVVGRWHRPTIRLTKTLLVRTYIYIYIYILYIIYYILYYIIFYSILFYSILFYSILFYSIIYYILYIIYIIYIYIYIHIYIYSYITTNVNSTAHVYIYTYIQCRNKMLYDIL